MGSFVALGLCVGFKQHLVHLSVDNITTHGKLEVRYPQNCRVVGISVPALDGFKIPAVLKSKLVVFRMPGQCRPFLLQWISHHQLKNAQETDHLI